jgi:hypothetical protein
LINVEST